MGRRQGPNGSRNNLIPCHLRVATDDENRRRLETGCQLSGPLGASKTAEPAAEIPQRGGVEGREKRGELSIEILRHFCESA